MGKKRGGKSPDPAKGGEEKEAAERPPPSRRLAPMYKYQRRVGPRPSQNGERKRKSGRKRKKEEKEP